MKPLSKFSMSELLLELIDLDASIASEEWEIPPSDYHLRKKEELRAVCAEIDARFSAAPSCPTAPKE